ncbi:MAG TPA: alpha-amylase family glycosyl hydrolase, partial [Candidatus Deferrimicrobiaceae bacterium]
MGGAARIDGMGAIPHQGGVAFRVWAPHAERVSVIGSFNGWNRDSHPMQPEANGYWYADLPEAHAGDRYKFLLATPNGEFKRIDPYAREVTDSVGDAIVHDPRFDWQGDGFTPAPWNELVIYELHVGTFNDQDDPEHPGDFPSVTARLGHLKKLGINAIQIMPVGEFAGERSWGYNPAHIFSVETAYGGASAFKQFVKRAHREGIAVILDVVYNHLGPGDLDLWQFDGWSENDRGGIYFYNDGRAVTPWGETRPDYGRGEVRQYLLDNVLMWLEEYRVDGIRFDCTQFIRTVNG